MSSSIFGLLCYRDMLIRLIQENDNENILLLSDENILLLADDHIRLINRLNTIEEILRIHFPLHNNITKYI